MDMNEYCLNMLARQRLADLREQAAHIALRAEARRGQPLRVIVGHALVRLGNRLASGVTPMRAAA
jgi:hypothetical protein